MLTRYTNVLKNLVVNKKQMLENITLTRGVVFSQRVLTKLIEKGMSREQSYDLTQKIAMQS
jgi:adenylosuccinate lyase